MARPIKGDERYYDHVAPKVGFEPVLTKVFTNADGYDLWVGGRREVYCLPRVCGHARVAFLAARRKRHGRESGHRLAECDNIHHVRS